MGYGSEKTLAVFLGDALSGEIAESKAAGAEIDALQLKRVNSRVEITDHGPDVVEAVDWLTLFVAYLHIGVRFQAAQNRHRIRSVLFRPIERALFQRRQKRRLFVEIWIVPR